MKVAINLFNMEVEEIIEKSIYEYSFYDFSLDDLINMFKLQTKVSNEAFVKDAEDKQKNKTKRRTNKELGKDSQSLETNETDLTEKSEKLIKKSLIEIEELKNIFLKYLSIPDNVLLPEDQIRDGDLEDKIQNLKDEMLIIEMEIIRNKIIQKKCSEESKEIDQLTKMIDLLDSSNGDFSNIDNSVIKTLINETEKLKDRLH